MLVAGLPIHEPDLATGPVLLREPRMLAVAARHPLARRASVSIEDLARDEVLRAPCADLDYWEASRVPERTPGGRPVERGRVTATFQETLALIGAGRGVYPVGAHVSRYYRRPDVAYVPFRDAPPLEWGLIWRRSGETALVRAFAGAAREAAEAPGAAWSTSPRAPGKEDLAREKIVASRPRKQVPPTDDLKRGNG